MFERIASSENGQEARTVSPWLVCACCPASPSGACAGLTFVSLVALIILAGICYVVAEARLRPTAGGPLRLKKLFCVELIRRTDGLILRPLGFHLLCGRGYSG